MRMVRYSELATYRLCPRRWYLLWYLGKTSKTAGTAPALLEGSAVHAGIEAYNRGLPTGDGIRAWAAQKSEESSEDDLVAVVDATGAAATYLEHYPEWVEEEALDAGSEIIDIEFSVELPFPEYGITITGTIDRAEYSASYGGDPIVVDYKTTSDFRHRPVQADAQLTTYALGLSRKLGQNVAAGRHVRIKKNKRTARAKPPWFDVHDNIYTAEQLRSAEVHLRAWTLRLADTIHTLDASDGGPYHVECPPNPGFHCTSPACPMLDVCNSMDDGSDWRGLLDTDFIDRANETKVELKL